jgi:outer membrane lipopolysaccharide assembly protein LptE/RlpB
MNNNRFKHPLLLIAFAAAALLAACGYQFAGSGPFPYGVKKVAVEVLVNRTRETGLENTITNDLIYELNRNGQVQVTDTEKADAILRGTIEKLTIRSVSRSQILTTEAERVFVQVDLELVRPSGEVLWKGKGIKEDEAY